MTTPWNDQFEQTLREHLPLLPAGHDLTPSTDLYELGLDSLQSVQLLISLEDALDVIIPDDALTADTFRTPSNIWAVVHTTGGD